MNYSFGSFLSRPLSRLLGGSPSSVDLVLTTTSQSAPSYSMSKDCGMLPAPHVNSTRDLAREGLAVPVRSESVTRLSCSTLMRFRNRRDRCPLLLQLLLDGLNGCFPAGLRGFGELVQGILGGNAFAAEPLLQGGDFSIEVIDQRVVHRFDVLAHFFHIDLRFGRLCGLSSDAIDEDQVLHSDAEAFEKRSGDVKVHFGSVGVDVAHRPDAVALADRDAIADVRRLVMGVVLRFRLFAKRLGEALGYVDRFGFLRRSATRGHMGISLAPEAM
jgi:hypothetical protein